MNALSLPALPDEVDASTLPALIELYLVSKLESGAITVRTEHNYRNQLNPWTFFWETQQDTHHNRLSPAILRKALAWMTTSYQTRLDRKAANTSIAHCWTRLKQVFNWAFAAGCTGGVNLSDWCPKVVREMPHTHYTSLDELRAILATIEGATRLRDTAALLFLAATGARRYEAAQALTEDINWNTPTTNLQVGADHRGWLWLAKVKGDRDGLKGKGRVVCFDATTGLILKAHLRSCGRTEGPIFDMSDTGLGQAIDRYAHTAGCEHVSPHAFRRMFADYWDSVNGDAGFIALKKIMGHGFYGDVTRGHYIRANVKRTAKQLMAVYVSPVDQLIIDWTAYPVHIPQETIR